MKTRIFFWTALMFLTVNAWSNGWAQENFKDLSKILPTDDEVKGLKLEQPHETFRGDELFMMINGGADIYYEYGFVQVVRATYAGPDGRRLKMEIYEMESPAAAYGMFTFKRGEKGLKMDIGQEAVLEEYYLNFWKGSLLCTIIGLDDEHLCI